VVLETVQVTDKVSSDDVISGLRMQLAFHQAREKRLESACLNLLRAPYREWYPYAIGIACNELDHPMRYEETPKFKENRCVCGKVVEESNAGIS
jgi:hypothetical protein